MKTDIVNGFEHLIFELNEIEEARIKEAAGHAHVHIAVPCVDCKCGPIWSSVANVDSGKEFRHSDNFHSSLSDEDL